MSTTQKLGKKTISGQAPTSMEKHPIRKTPFILLALFTLLIVVGICTGEPERVLEQAKSICLECIGIG